MRSQVSVYIILGMILLVLIGIGIYLRSTINPVEPEVYDASKEGIISYVESCISQVSEPLIYDLAVNGGTLEPQSSVIYNGEEYTYIIINKENNYVNDLRITKNGIEAELASKIQEGLFSCIDFSQFEQQVTKISRGQMTVNVTLGEQHVKISLQMQVDINNNNDLISLDTFSSDIDLALGEIYILVNDIINNELSEKHFNHVKYMQSNGIRNSVEKHKPYPDIVYEIIKKGDMRDLIFRFAIKGFDTAFYTGSKDSLYTTRLSLGSCIQNDVCYLNTEEADCDGDWNNRNTCALLQYSGNEKCSSSSCEDCTSIDKKHGESWCAFESTAGKGFDYVGSRHFRFYCMDGVVYSEDCRDFREEICAEEQLPESTNAVCRENRWQDCTMQDTQEKCHNQSTRDCSWSGSLGDQKTFNNEMLCHPEVPPGFKFWQRKGRNVCTMGNDWRICDGVNCPQSWMEIGAMYCYRLGDCGNYRNVADVISNERKGFYSTEERINDMTRPIREYVYLTEYQIGYITSQLNLTIEADNHIIVDSEHFLNPKSNPDAMRIATQNYINDVRSWNKRKIMRKYFEDGELDVYIIALNFCDVWKPPYEGQCEFCEDSDLYPCTEYKCRSLGEDCVYKETAGFGKCSKADDDEKGPTLVLDEDKLDSAYLAPKDLYLDYRGYKIKPKVVPGSFFKLPFKTSEESICQMSYFPSEFIDDLPNIGVQEEIDPSLDHEFNVWILETDMLREIMRSSFDVDSFIELATILVDYRTGFVTLAQKYGIDVDDLLDVVDTFFDNSYIEYLKAMVLSADQNRLYFFISCTDSAGNTNSDVFVRFDIIENYKDTQAPFILGIEPESGSTVSSEEILVRLYVNEPVECRYSNITAEFNEMTDLFQCESLFPFFAETGSLQCLANIELKQNENDFHISCKDNPLTYITYYINIERSQNFSFIPENKMINLSEPDRVYIPSMSTLAANDTIIRVNRPQMTLMLNNTYDAICKLSKHAPFEMTRENMNCNYQTNFSICSATIDVPLQGKDSYMIGCAYNSAQFRNLLDPVVDYRVIRNT